ncbi:sugar-phosphatase [Lentilactobacillus parabuchneri]|uniref:sugar-phosphatase n=1 Tax=Lentilactobacillus parabuchneri TaxID=152331 RepID=UPI00178C8788|nr:sugar-phosphatase [Lentilactobacillus parabuchneri]QOJ84506.1 sugar-phosphatase [Lentilactobacillus parabuchneri]
MDIKLIAIDIDGTLLNEKNELAQATIDAIQLAKQKGVKVVLCTGRPLSGVQPYLDKLEITGKSEFAITFNGAMAQSLDGNVMVNHTITYDDFLETEMLSRKLNVHYQIETTDSIYTTNRDTNPYGIAESFLVRLPIKFRSPEEIPRDLVMSKAMFVDFPDQITKAKALIPASLKEKMYVVQTEPFFIEMMNKQASKGKTLGELAAQFNLTEDNVMAIGDQGNDLTMVKYAGLGVAMGNAIDEVKQAAQFVTKPNSEDGVAFAINKYVN